MRFDKHKKIYFIQEILDVFFLIVFFFIYLKFQYIYFGNEYDFLENIPTFLELFKFHFKALILLMVSWFLISKNIGLYKIHKITKFIEIVKRLTYQFIIFSIVVFSISGFKTSDLFSPQLGLIYVFTLYTLGFLSRFYIFNLLKKWHVNNKYLSKILIIDENDNTEYFVNVLNNRKDLGIRLIDKISVDDIEFGDDIVKIKNQSFSSYLEKNEIERIFISIKGKFTSKTIRRVVNLAESNLVPVAYIPDSIYNGFTELKIVHIDTLPIFKIKRFPLDLRFNQMIKDFFDLIFAMVVCVLILSWLFPLISLLIFLDSRGSILFVQKRNGLNGKEFNCYKFRTMVNSEENSIKATERNDPRVTRVGKFLRKTSLDELPQFLNVLKGEMSIVGPRPHMISQDYYYRKIISKYNVRHYVKPGITGLSQVKGYRGAIDSDQDMDNRIRTDIYYIRNWSYLLDIQIIYQTILLVVKGDENAI